MEQRRDGTGILPNHPWCCQATSEQPNKFLTNAFIQAVAYRGSERNAAYQLDVRDIMEPLDVQIVEACSFVEKNMQVYANKELTRCDIPQYAGSL